MIDWMDGSLLRNTFKLDWYRVAAVMAVVGAGDGDDVGNVLLTDGVLRLCGVIVVGGMSKRSVHLSLQDKRNNVCLLLMVCRTWKCASGFGGVKESKGMTKSD